MIMQTIERVIILALLRDMRAAGYQAAAVWDGGEYVMAKHDHTPRYAFDDSPSEMERPLTDDEVLAAVDSVDTSTLHFTHQHLTTWGNRGAMLILGNGVDIISDYHAPDEDKEPFSGIFTAIYDRLENGQVP